MNKGIVYIIGGGPGSPELITLKAAEVLKICDVVLYDRLANNILLDLCKYDCERIYVGKQPGKKHISQDEIIKIMINKAKDGKSVARLKGGDPYMFGRGSEEALALANEGISFEVIPGISAAFGAAAYSGIPLTHREQVTQCIFITAHESPDKPTSQIEWEKIAQMKNTTLTVYMGSSLLSEISETLISYGMSNESAVAIIENATLPGQRTFITTLKELKNITDINKIKPPVLLIISPNVIFYDKINWFEKKPLFGKKILLTRASDQSYSLYKMLSNEGAIPVLLPVIKTGQIIPRLKINDLLSKKKYDWLIFTSENGVRYFFNILKNEGFDNRRLAGLKIAANGSGTKSKLAEYGIIPDLIPDKYTTEFLFQKLISTEDIRKKTILRIKGNFKSDPLTDNLRNNGAIVDTYDVYETSYTHPPDNVINETLDQSLDVAIFTSSSTIDAFINIIGTNIAVNFLNNIKVVAIGPITAQRIINYGINNVITSKQHNLQGIVDSVKSIFNILNINNKS